MNAINRIDWTVGGRPVQDIFTSLSALGSRREGFAPQTSRRGSDPVRNHSHFKNSTGISTRFVLSRFQLCIKRVLSFDA